MPYFMYLLMVFTFVSCRGKTIKDWSADQQPQAKEPDVLPSQTDEPPPELAEALRAIDEDTMNNSPLISNSNDVQESPSSPNSIGGNDYFASTQMTPSCEGGSIDGNSGKNLTFELNPWYLTQNPNADTVNYCIDSFGPEEHDKHFSVKIGKMKYTISEVLSAWRIYLLQAEQLSPYFDKTSFFGYDKYSSDHAFFEVLEKAFDLSLIPESLQNLRIVKNFNEVTCLNNPDLIIVLGKRVITKFSG